MPRKGRLAGNVAEVALAHARAVDIDFLRVLPLGGVEEQFAILDEEGSLICVKATIAGSVLFGKVDEEVALGGAYKAQVQ